MNSLYVDPHAAESREMDIVVRDLVGAPEARPTLWVSVVAECKAWKKPIVAIGQSRERYWAARTFEEAIGGGDAISAMPLEARGSFGGVVPFLGLRTLPSSVESAGFMGRQLVLLDRNGAGYKAENASVNQSAILPLVKAMRYEQRQLLGVAPDLDEGPARMVISFPILVTSGPVLEAEPSGTDASVREVGWTRLVRKMMDPKLPSSAIVEIVQEDALQEWLDVRLTGFVDEVSHRLASAKEIFDPVRIPSLERLSSIRAAWV